MAKQFTGSVGKLVLFVIICWPYGLYYYFKHRQEQGAPFPGQMPGQPPAAPGGQMVACRWCGAGMQWGQPVCGACNRPQQ